MAAIYSTWGYVQNVSADYIASPEDGTLLVNTTGGSRTITLPIVVPGPESFSYFCVKRVTGGLNSCTVDVVGSGTIDGASSILIAEQNQAILFQATGIGQYSIVSAFDPGIL